MDEETRRENEAFETQVRRIARELWPHAGGYGPVVVDGRERDGIFETEECVHLVEATVSRRKDKAEVDVKKLVSLAAQLQKRHPAKAVKCWFITRDDPTHDQRSVADKKAPLVTIFSFAQFQAKIIDAGAYLSVRDNYPFGSVRDPATGAASPTIDYIPLDLADTKSGQILGTGEILDLLLDGRRLVVLGDYGSGKSMTLRHLYQELRKRHLTGRSMILPVYLNLRDHFGQNDPAEILERHAKIVGFAYPHQLVRAWRAGYLVLLLDGFDEVTAVGIQGLWRKLQDNRYRAMEPVRRFVRDHPRDAGLILAGRAHFFDSESERRRALGLPADFREMTVAEFTNEQVQSYLKKSGLPGSLPPWLPSRPLLIGYLVAKGVLRQLNSGAAEATADPAAGWNVLLDAVTEREARIEAGIDGRTVRRILERLATKARSYEGGLGPLSGDDVVSAFRDICGYNPDERGMVLLQRLPGLGVDRPEEETRAFIDEDFADACGGGDVVNFIVQPYDGMKAFQVLECALRSLGVSVAAELASAAGFTAKQLNAALQQAVGTGEQHLVMDLYRITCNLGFPIEDQIYVRGIVIPDCEFSAVSGDASRVVFQDCFFRRVEFDVEINANGLPHFERCYIGELDGRVSRADLPAGIFDNECVIDEFTQKGETTAAILALDLPLGARVLLTVLRKLYYQRGSGRKESALERGLDHRARRLVPGVLRLVESEGIAIRYRKGNTIIWLPNRMATKRVGHIVTSPTICEDSLVAKAGALD